MHLWKVQGGTLERPTKDKFDKASRRLRSEPRVDLEKECSRQGQLQVQSQGRECQQEQWGPGQL